MTPLPLKCLSAISAVLLVITICDGVLWYKVNVSTARLDNLARKKSSMTIEAKGNLTHPYIPYLPKCNSNPWCSLVCFNLSTGMVTLSELLVKPNYQETDTNNALLCYTKLKKDYAVGMASGGSTPDYASLSLEIDALLDGIYGYTNVECYKSIYQIDPWIYIDLALPTKISVVKLMFQPNSNAAKMYNIEVRLHPDGAIPTDPSSGKLYGLLSTPAVPGEWVTFANTLSPSARYITIQRFTDSDCNVNPVPSWGHCCLRFCQLEIY